MSICTGTFVLPEPSLLSSVNGITVRGQLVGEELKVRTGQVDRGWVDKHSKLLAMASLLVEKSSTRSFAVSLLRTAGHATRLGRVRWGRVPG